MVKGIGIDIICIEKIRSLWENHRHRLQGVVFTEKELEAVGEGSPTQAETLPYRQALLLATTFAAKEATVKALGLPYSTRYELADIEVCRSDHQVIHLSPSLAALARTKGIDRLTCSIAAAGQYASAVVIGESL